jgi:hypothetical protein
MQIINAHKQKVRAFSCKKVSNNHLDITNILIQSNFGKVNENKVANKKPLV